VTPAEIAAAAARIVAAERARRQTGLVSRQHPEATLEDAYAVQAAVVAARVAAGARPVGWKIGLTSRAMQQQLGIDTPDSGVLFDDMLFADGAAVPPGRFIAPRVEAEIAFGLAADLPADADRGAVLAATAWVAPALEILDTRILRSEAGQPRSIVDTVADNAANAGLVLGTARHPPGRFDLRWVGAILARDGVVEETGLGAGVLDDPVAGIVWLARRVGGLGGRLRAGEVVLSGSFVRAVEAPPGSRFAADFGPFGRVAVAFA
jgi:2-oxo-hept-3-ene-1,7-dioate hydratase